MNYYNEIDPFAADWLRELIKAGVISPGEVDERSIEDVAPVDLRGFSQCHFFAGIGVWSYALRQAGWPDDRPVWTGSCPCQPFSAAGKRGGFADERHLWPAFFHLIEICRPVAVFGEQVGSKLGLAWVELVFSDLEGTDYTCGAVNTPAAGFGSPHVRQRLWWVANADANGPLDVFKSETGQRAKTTSECGGPDGVANPLSERPGGRGDGDKAGMRGEVQTQGRSTPDGVADAQCDKKHKEQQKSATHEGEGGANGLSGCGMACGLADTCGARLEVGSLESTREKCSAPERGGPNRGFWSNAVWLPCRDGKARPVEPCLGQVADGVAHDLGLVRFQGCPPHQNQEVVIFNPLIHKGRNRVGRLRGYGNAIVAQQAEAFIRACF